MHISIQLLRLKLRGDKSNTDKTFLKASLHSCGWMLLTGCNVNTIVVVVVVLVVVVLLVVYLKDTLKYMCSYEVIYKTSWVDYFQSVIWY